MLRGRYGKQCPKCRLIRPKSCPTILLPQQKCKVDGYRDPRPRIEEESVVEIEKLVGLTREDAK